MFGGSQKELFTEAGFRWAVWKGLDLRLGAVHEVRLRDRQSVARRRELEAGGRVVGRHSLRL